LPKESPTKVILGAPIVVPQDEPLVVFTNSKIYEDIKDQYSKAYDSCIVTANKSELDYFMKIVLNNKSRYEAISKETNVPWAVIAVIHSMECDSNFTQYLGNGDSLDLPTVDVPTGRGPFKSFEDGAIDALKYDGLDKVTDWSIPHMLFTLEKFNGLGYRIGHGQATFPARTSPYLWSGTNYYKSGKYVSDGEFDSYAVSKQVGCVAKLKSLKV